MNSGSISSSIFAKLNDKLQETEATDEANCLAVIKAMVG